MNKRLANFLLSISSLCLVACGSTQGNKPTIVTFPSSENKATTAFAIKDISQELPADWESYNFLILEMKASSPQRFYLSLSTPHATMAKGIQPFPGAKIRFCIPLDYFRKLPASAVDMAATYNKMRPLGMINIHNAGVGELTQVDSISFYMYSPVNDPALEIFSISLSVDDPGDALLQHTYLVDAFGQWATNDWDGKIKSLAQLQAEWKHEDESLSPLFPDASQYGGYANTMRKASGFFRTEKVDGKWWFVDPDGYLFLSVGVDCMASSVITKTTGRESVYEGLQDTAAKTADYYRWNLRKRYGDENVSSQWINTAVARMKSWGLNTVANWSSRDMINAGRMPFVLSLPGLQLDKGVMGLPDVYDPQYAASIDKSIGLIAGEYKANPWLLGYFVGNEQPWPGQESTLCDRILEGVDRPMKTFLNEYIQKHGDSPQSRQNFVYETFDKFLALVNSTLKKHDPNHLNIGMRFGGETPDNLLALAGKHFDVFSYNCYEIVPSREFMDRVDRLTGLPVIIGEYHFGVPDRGMAAGIVQVASQADRGIAYRYYNEQAYAHPSLIGAHWFQWIDQPNTGRMDGENYNIGLLDVTDRPYPEMVKAMNETHKRLYALHRGEITPYSEKAKRK